MTSKSQVRLDSDFAMALQLQDQEYMELELDIGKKRVNGISLGQEDRKRYRKDMAVVDLTDNLSPSFTPTSPAPPTSSNSSSSAQFAFRLNTIDSLSADSNADTLCIADVVNVPTHKPARKCLLVNYMFDLAWMNDAIPGLKNIPEVHIVYDRLRNPYIETDALLLGLGNCLFYAPPLPTKYSCMHAKMAIVIYDKSVRIGIHTANYIPQDWLCKNQGIWLQDFPEREVNKKEKGVSSEFERYLISFLNSLSLDSSFVSELSRYDFSRAEVMLVASVPGIHKNRQKFSQLGHMRVRNILSSLNSRVNEEEQEEKEQHYSQVICQFSSIGSIDEKGKWLKELGTSFCPHGKFCLKLIWPTISNVVESLEGESAGASLCCPAKNMKSCIRDRLCKWESDVTTASHEIYNRAKAMPHMKTYCQLEGNECDNTSLSSSFSSTQPLLWVLLTSANLSKAAFGSFQKNESQLYIAHYEIGVLFHTSLQTPVSKSASSSTTTSKQKHSFVATRNSRNVSSSSVCFPFPYKLPPSRYSKHDEPWIQEY